MIFYKIKLVGNENGIIKKVVHIFKTTNLYKILGGFLSQLFILLRKTPFIHEVVKLN